jgi:two-component system sensor histidine kinase VanS
MKHSIKTKLFLLFAGVLAVFLLAGCLCSTLLLQRYYISENKALFAQTASQVEAALSEEPPQLQGTIAAIDRAESISITVASADETVLYTSYPRKDANGSRLPKEISELIAGGGSTAYGKVTAGEGSAARIAYARLTGGKWIVLTKQLKGVAESAAIANRFFAICAAAALMLGGLVIYLFSGKIVRPVLEMNRVARSIAELDFQTIPDICSKDELGELAGSINVISEKLENSVRSLRKDVAYQKQLTRDTSHELKTPIGVIKGYAEGLLYGVADDPDSMKEYCRTIASECDRMDELVKDMLELSALEAGDAAPKRTEFPARELLCDVADSFQPLLADKGIRCACECPEDLTVSADCAMMKRALGNFLTNAVRYGDENRYIRLSARRDGRRVRFSVYNTGSGVPEAELGKIWDTFYKVDKARTREAGGHGLGLAMVKSIAELHSGDCGAENQKGGIEFFIAV